MGLNDLGLGQNTLSSQLRPGSPADAQPRGGGLAEIMRTGGLMQSMEQRARQLAQARQRLEATETSSGLGMLTSNPRNILALLLAGGAAAFGGEEGQAAGLGIGLGALQKGDLLAAQAQEQKAAGIQNLIEQEQQVFENQMKLRNTYANLLIGNPDAFVNPETGEMDPNLLGEIILGDSSIPLHAGSKRALAQIDERWKLGWTMLADSYEASENEADRGKMLETMQAYLGNPEYFEDRPGLLSAMARVPEESFSLMMEDLWQTSPDRYIAATDDAMQRGLEVNEDLARDPRFVAHWRNLPKETDQITYSQYMNKEWIDARDIWSSYWQGRWAEQEALAAEHTNPREQILATMRPALEEAGRMDLLPEVRRRLSGETDSGLIPPEQQLRLRYGAERDVRRFVDLKLAGERMATDDPDKIREITDRAMQGYNDAYVKTEQDKRTASMERFKESLESRISNHMRQGNVEMPVGMTPEGVVREIIMSLEAKMRDAGEDPRTAPLHTYGYYANQAVKDWVEGNRP